MDIKFNASAEGSRHPVEHILLHTVPRQYKDYFYSKSFL